MPQENNERPKSAGKTQSSSPAASGVRHTAAPSSGSRRPTNTAGSGTQASPQRPRRKRRRRRMNPLLYILLVLAVSGLLAGLGWIWAGDVLALNKPAASAVITLPADMFTSREIQEEVKTDSGTETTTRTISVPDLDYVADLLEENGLIEYKFLFKLFCAFTGVEKKGKLQPGTYELTTDMDYHALINSMSSSSGSRMTIEVMIPEGYTIDQIFALLEEKGVSTVETLQKVAATYDYKWDFLQQDAPPLGDYHRLEGYLFPDTYEFYMGGGESAAVQVLNKMIQRLDELFTDELRAQAEEMGYTFHEMLTIASLIEKETDGDDQSTIASVIYNRLNSNEAGTNGYLQIDATLVYINGGNTPTEADKSIDSPYNTYLYPGLPEGPIANPGMAALYAAVNPENTKYFYYALGDDNSHHFFQTYSGFTEFLASQERYNHG